MSSGSFSQVAGIIDGSRIVQAGSAIVGLGVLDIFDILLCINIRCESMAIRGATN